MWTARARARRHQIYNYIAQDQPLNAERVVNRSTFRAKQLTEQPRSGRMADDYQREDIRELIERPYRFSQVKAIASASPQPCATSSMPVPD